MMSKIKEIRIKKNLTQRQLAEKLGVAQVTIHKLETGTSELDIKWIRQLAIALDIMPIELLPDEFISKDEIDIIKIVRENNPSKHCNHNKK